MGPGVPPLGVLSLRLFFVYLGNIIPVFSLLPNMPLVDSFAG